METPLTDKQYLLKRFPGKGGWTYVEIPEIPKDKDVPFGIVKVKGMIDDYEIKGYSLMSMGNDCLLLAVKAQIRSKIGKEEGDHVHVVLYRDNAPYEMPEELKLRLQEENVYQAYLSRKNWEQKMCAEWIFSAKREETKNERIIKTIYRLQRREKII